MNSMNDSYAFSVCDRENMDLLIGAGSERPLYISDYALSLNFAYMDGQCVGGFTRASLNFSTFKTIIAQVIILFALKN